MKSLFLVLGISAALLLPSVLGGPTEHPTRGPPKDLSDQEHYEGDGHNADYDHEAFLGKDQAKEFDNLTPEESKRRLG